MGRTVQGASTSWSVLAGDGTVTPPVVATDAQGQAGASWTMGTTPGENALVARVVGVDSVTFQATALVGSPSALERVSGNEQVGTFGSSLPDSFVIAVSDSFGNAVAALPVAWELTVGSGSISPESASTDDAGRASALLTLGTTEGTHRVQAKVSGLDPVEFLTTAVSDLDPGLRASFAGIQRDEYLHGPHLSIAAGPGSVILSSTGGLELRSKDGTLLDDALSDQLFGPVKHPEAGLGDLVVIFDQIERRYLILVMDRVFDQQGCEAAPGANSCLSHLLLAVSKTSDPASLRPGDWHLFSLDTTHDMIDGVSSWNASWNDVPQLAANDDVVVIATQQIPLLGNPNTDPRPFKVRVLEKEPLMRGVAPVTWQDFVSPVEGQNFGWLVPGLSLMEPGTVFFASSGGPSCAFFVWALEGMWPNTKLRPANLAASSFACPDPPPGAPQPGTEVLLDAIASTRPTLFAAYHNGSLWATRTTGQELPGGTVAAVHWAEIDVSAYPGQVRIAQEGIIGEDDVHTFHPAIGVDRSGNAVFVFHRTGDDRFPSIYFTGRSDADPLGEMRVPRILRSGSASMPPSGIPFHRNGVQLNRFVDHTGIGYDSSTDEVWVLGQYVEAVRGFATWVGRISWND